MYLVRPHQYGICMQAQHLSYACSYYIISFRLRLNRGVPFFHFSVWDSNGWLHSREPVAMQLNRDGDATGFLVLRIPSSVTTGTSVEIGIAIQGKSDQAGTGAQKMNENQWHDTFIVL